LREWLGIAEEPPESCSKHWELLRNHQFYRSCFESGKSVVDTPQFFGSSETDLGPDYFSILGLPRYDDIL
jgi:hypothetical protein